MQFAHTYHTSDLAYYQAEFSFLARDNHVLIFLEQAHHTYCRKYQPEEETLKIEMNISLHIHNCSQWFLLPYSTVYKQ